MVRSCVFEDWGVEAAAPIRIVRNSTGDEIGRLIVFAARVSRNETGLVSMDGRRCLTGLSQYLEAPFSFEI